MLRLSLRDEETLGVKEGGSIRASIRQLKARESWIKLAISAPPEVGIVRSNCQKKSPPPSRGE